MANCSWQLHHEGHDGRFAGLGSKIGPKPPPRYHWKANIKNQGLPIGVKKCIGSSVKIYFIHFRQDDRGFARSRLCTKNGTTNNLVYGKECFGQ